MKNTKEMVNLKEIKGVVYDESYSPLEFAYGSVTDFIDDISKIEMNLAKSDFPESYKEDEFFIKYKKLKEDQSISMEDLNSLLENYSYIIIK